MNLDGLEQAVSPRIVGGTARVLTIDIERLPGLAPVWDQKTRFIPVSQWRRLPQLLSVAAKWYDRSRVEFHGAWDDPRALVEWSWELYDTADVVVTYNGRRFDNKHLRGAWALAGLPPPTPWRDVDLFAENVRLFAFESKSLAHLCRQLDVPGKHGHYDALVAEAAMAGDVKAQRQMAVYNRQDVRATEAVYDRLRPWLKNHPHVTRSAEAACNRCGSQDLERLARDYRAVVIDYALYRCQSCGGLVRGMGHRRAAITRGVE